MPLPLASAEELHVAILAAISTCDGSAKVKDLYGLVQTYFPDLTKDELAQTVTNGSESLWHNQIRWARNLLVDKGYIGHGPWGVWPITDAGRTWLQDKWTGTPGDYAYASLKTPSPSAVPKSSASSQATDVPTGSDHSESVIGSGNEKLDPIDSLCERLLINQHNSKDPTLFEKNVAEAFGTLGFDAKHIGGPNETDVHLHAPLRVEGYSAIIDAKTTHHDTVIDANINWSAIALHRSQHNADYAAVVGSSFASGHLLKFADQHHVILITTNELVEVLNLHKVSPFTLIELRNLFTPSDSCKAEMDSLRKLHEQRLRRWSLLVRIIDTIGGWPPPTVTGLYYALLASPKYTSLPNLHDLAEYEVEEAVQFLLSPAINVLGKVPVDKIQLVISPQMARRVIRALAQYVNEV